MDRQSGRAVTRRENSGKGARDARWFVPSLPWGLPRLSKGRSLGESGKDPPGLTKTSGVNCIRSLTARCALALAGSASRWTVLLELYVTPFHRYQLYYVDLLLDRHAVPDKSIQIQMPFWIHSCSAGIFRNNSLLAVAEKNF